MRVLIDTNVVLDLLLDRPEFVDDAAGVWEANEQGRLDAYISAITPVNVFYIARKLKGAEKARQAVVELMTAIRICPVDQIALKNALSLPLIDYEDAVQLASATASQLDAIVTRNTEDFKNVSLPVLTPKEILAQIAAEL